MTDFIDDNAAPPKEEIASPEFWLNRIAGYEKQFKKWEGRVDKILKRYRDDYRDGSRTDRESRFNILWSNVQTLVPAVFARLPRADVTRRFKDNDPIGRVAANILERALDFEIEHYTDYRTALKNSISDRFLGGRGTAWVRYEPHIANHSLEITGNIPEPNESLAYECTPVDYVYWKDFGHTVARTWEEVKAVWRKVYLTREAVTERFGEEWSKKIPLDARPDDSKKGIDNDGKSDNTALIYEIWDKESGKALWLSKSLGKIIDEQDDPLQLQDFFPCPKPLYATLTTDTLVPLPDFSLYQDQANDLDILSDRIDGLIKALRIRGVYNAEFKELARLFTEGDNKDLIAVKTWQSFAEKNGLNGAIDLVDINPIAEALLAAYQAMEQVKNQIYELTGIADIIRGSTDADETATAQQLKSSYASLRLRNTQGDVAMYATEILRIKAEIICTSYTPETLQKIAGTQQMEKADLQFIPQALELLKNEPLRGFRIEIAADSMVALDENQEKADRVSFLDAVGKFLQGAMQAAATTPQIAPLAGELLKFGVRGFKVGKSIEGELDQAMDQLKQAAQQAMQNPPPNPDIMKIQAQQQQSQQEGQLRMQELQAEAQTNQQKNQMEAQREALDRQHQAQVEQLKIQSDQALAAQKQQFDANQALAQLAFDKWQAELDATTKITIAEIAAGASLKSTAMKLGPTPEPGPDMGELVGGVTDKLEELLQLHSAPKVIERDASGKAISISGRPIQRGPDGKVIGLQ